jgi:hypothetical protein
MKRDRTFTFIIVLMLALLAFLLYRVTGGDLTWFTQAQNGAQGGSFLDTISNGLLSVGDGIGKVFNKIRP